MGFLDKAKGKAEEAVALAKDAAEKAAAKVEENELVEKAASFVDNKTKGKYSDKIAKVASTAKGSVAKLNADGGDETGEEGDVPSMEYSTEFGAEPTEDAAQAAEVFEEEPPQA